MHNENREIDRIFAQALEQPTSTVGEFLDHQCPDAATRREVEALLRFGDADTNLLDASIVSMPEVLDLPPGAAETQNDRLEDLPEVERSVGPYRLEKVLGRGGMGVVYLAARDDGHFEQRVALKRLTPRPELGTAGGHRGDSERRFERERQILASLDHPSIARLIDGGVTQDGSPFFAMEVVDGLPIDAYCDQHRLNVVERLKLFRQVVEAVSHAHAKLILHRDLKPSNILVTAEGVVKLLDFGIATLLEPVGGSATTSRWLTPEIASPEQVRGEPMSTRADIYQLGLLLYLLLTGRRAYAVPTSSPSAAERVICEVDPPPPSRLAPALDGDLDSVVLQCLRKDPSRRYQSVEALANDLHRHDAGLPVLAHPDSWLYRFGKLARRQRRAFLVGGLLLALASYHLITMQQQSSAMEVERNRAVAEAEKAEAIKDFLVDLFESANPAEARGHDLTVREVLDRGTPRIETLFVHQPEVRTELLATTGDLYRALGLYPEAEALLRKAFENRTGDAAQRTPPSPPHLMRLARLHTDQGDPAVAEKFLFQALESLRATPNSDRAQLADVLDAIGDGLVRQQRYREAPAFLDEALAMRRELYGDQHVDVARSLTHLGLLALRVDEYARAEDQLRQAFTLRLQLLPPGHPELASARSNLASALRHLDRIDEALPLMHEAVAERRHVLGDDHPYTAISLSVLAQVQREADRFDEAAESLEQALEIRRRVLEPDHPMIAANLNDLGLARRDLGDLTTAAEHYLEALSIYAPDHPWRRTTQLNLAGVLRLEGRYDEAIGILRRVLAVDLQSLGPEHTHVALLRWELGLALRDLNDLEAAADELEKGYWIHRAKLPEGHPLRGGLAAHLGNLWVDLGRLDDADALLNEAHPALRERLGEDHRYTARAALGLGRLHLARDQQDAAEPWLIAAQGNLSPNDRVEAAQLTTALMAVDRLKARDP